MKLIRTNHFKKCYQALPKEIQKQTDKNLRLLIENPKHPSLRVKKIQGTRDIWEASVTMKYRFTFQVVKGTLTLRKIGEHDKTLKNP